MSTRLSSVKDRVDKIFTFQAQWLDPINMRNGNSPKAIGDYWISMNISTFIVDFDHLGRIRVIIHHHSGITNDSDTANFTGMEPAHMDMSSHRIGKFEIEMGNIVNMRL